jgi:uncharacterized membrane protein YgdD (TMEM256/DUF423 family)
MTERFWIQAGAICGFLAVGLGAFGAHALEATLVEYDTLSIWETASRYHLAHAVAIVLVPSTRQCAWRPALWFVLGIIIFSGSLYLMALTNWRWLGMITPIGGLSFLIGWARMFWAFNRHSPKQTGEATD